MFDDFQEVFNHIRANVLRTTLTGISVSMGIFLLIILLGAGNGVINAFKHNQKSSAIDVIKVNAGETSLPYGGWPQDRKIQLKLKDARLLSDNYPENVTAAIPSEQVNNVKIKANGRMQISTIVGATPALQGVNQMGMLTGRYINASDLQDNTKVVVIGRKMAKFFFDNIDSIMNKTLNIGGIGYLVVGVFDDNNLYQYSTVYVPLSTMQMLWQKGTDINTINLRTKALTEDSVITDFQNDVVKYMAQQHDFSPNDENAVYTSSQAQMTKASNTAYTYVERGLWIVGLLTLLSGVASISNIMLITVRERTHEFGIRKAIGARPWSILRSVLLESLLITFFFGYLGLVVGVIGIEIMKRVVGNDAVTMFGSKVYIFLDPNVSLTTALQALLVLIIAGLLAGFLPAFKAVRVKPVEALRAK